MKGPAAAAAALVLACACSSSPVASGSPSPKLQPTPTASAIASTSTSGSPSPAPSSGQLPRPAVACIHRATTSNLVLLGRPNGVEYVYEVRDPTHPVLLCKLTGTSASLPDSGGVEYLDAQGPNDTEITYRRFSDGIELPVGKISGFITSGAFYPAKGTLGAYTVQVPSQQALGGSEVQVWTYDKGSSDLLFKYPIGIGDCICRFGLPPPVLAISTSGHYLVAGHLTGKGSQPLAIYDLLSGNQVATLDGFLNAFWNTDPQTEDRLFAISGVGVSTWTDEDGLRALANANPWSYLPGMSADASAVAYTAYLDANETQPRVFVYDIVGGTTRMLSSAMRTQAVFVKDGWVWYLEEQPCAQCTGQTKPSGKVFAMDLSTGVESQVTFRSGEGATDLAPVAFWPNS